MDKNTQRFVDSINTKLTELVGQKISYKHWDAIDSIYYALGEWYNECIDSSFNKLNASKLFEVTQRHPKNYFEISYRGFSLAYVYFQKTKGDTHNNIIYYSTDYFYKSFEFKWGVADQGFTEETETIEQRLQCTDTYLKSLQDRNEEYLEKTIRIVKAIKRELGENASISDALEMASYISNHKYDIMNKIKGE